MPALLWASCGSQIISQIAGGILAPGAVPGVHLGPSGSPSRGSPAKASSFVFLKLKLIRKIAKMPFAYFVRFPAPRDLKMTNTLSVMIRVLSFPIHGRHHDQVEETHTMPILASPSDCPYHGR